MKINIEKILNLINECENAIKIEVNITNEEVRLHSNEYKSLGLIARYLYKDTYKEYIDSYRAKIEVMNFYMNVLESEKKRITEWLEIFNNDLKDCAIPEEFHDMIVSIIENSWRNDESVN